MQPAREVLIIKFAALGDVLRTTSILPGLKRALQGARVTWLTAPGAKALVERHRLVDEVVAVDLKHPAAEREAVAKLEGRRFEWTISLDDEAVACRIASAVPAARISGAFLDAAGRPTYSDDVEPWFGMGLLAKDGKDAADRRKVENRRSHPEILATMLGLEPGKPELPLDPAAGSAAAAIFSRFAIEADRRIVGLNTGAGSRWRTKELRIDELVALAARLDESLDRKVTFVLLGGREESVRNAEIARRLDALAPRISVRDAGTDHPLERFAAIVSRLDLLLTSDSLALHVAVARDVPLVAFFAPTSAAEIELYGLGEKIASTAADYCSYRPDADNSTITAQRLLPAVLRTLARGRGRS